VTADGCGQTFVAGKDDGGGSVLVQAVEDFREALLQRRGVIRGVQDQERWGCAVGVQADGFVWFRNPPKARTEVADQLR
jgi:hypothetical protein